MLTTRQAATPALQGNLPSRRTLLRTAGGAGLALALGSLAGCDPGKDVFERTKVPEGSGLDVMIKYHENPNSGRRCTGFEITASKGGTLIVTGTGIGTGGTIATIYGPKTTKITEFPQKITPGEKEFPSTEPKKGVLDIVFIDSENKVHAMRANF